MQLTKYLIQLTGLSGDALFGTNGNGSNALCRLSADSQGNPTISYWAVPNIAQPSDTVLKDALNQADPAASQAMLNSYASTVQGKVLAIARTYNVAASGATAVNVLCDGTNSTRADLGLLALYGQTNPTGTKSWVDNNGATTQLTGTQCVQLATLVGSYIDTIYAALGTLLGQISSGTITTTAQIDAYTWPTA